MSPDPLGTALHDLVDDVEDGLAHARRRRAVGRWAPPPPHRPPRPGRGRRLRRRPGHRSRSGRPAPRVPRCPPCTFDDDGYGAADGLPLTHPQAPVRAAATARPGCHRRGGRAGWASTLSLYAVSPAGAPRRLLAAADVQGSIRPAVSPGRSLGLSQGRVLTDLVGGAAVPVESERAGSSRRGRPAGSAWWSPDSRRVFVDGIQPRARRGPRVTSWAPTAR